MNLLEVPVMFYLMSILQYVIKAPVLSFIYCAWLYVALRDASNRTGVVVYPDTEILKATTWTVWTIPLSDFANAGVNMAAVKKMFIGVGDRANPVPGGAGSLYFDDIYLTRPLPAGE